MQFYIYMASLKFIRKGTKRKYNFSIGTKNNSDGKILKVIINKQVKVKVIINKQVKVIINKQVMIINKQVIINKQ